MKQASAEGFRYGDGTGLNERKCEDITALNKDKTINFVGYVGHITFGSSTDFVGDDRLLRVDYQKYINGARDYIVNCR